RPLDHDANVNDASMSIEFRVNATDGVGGEIQRSFNIIVNDDAPQALADSVTGAEDTEITGDLSGRVDAGADGLAASGYTTVQGPTHGTFVLHANGNYTYTPNTNFNGTDSFTYTVT